MIIQSLIVLTLCASTLLFGAEEQNPPKKFTTKVYEFFTRRDLAQELYNEINLGYFAHPEKVRLLLRRGAPAEQWHKHKNLLLYAVENGCTKTVIELLLQHGAAVNASDRIAIPVQKECASSTIFRGETPLLAAINRPDAKEIIPLLIAHRADVNKRASYSIDAFKSPDFFSPEAEQWQYEKRKKFGLCFCIHRLTHKESPLERALRLKKDMPVILLINHNAYDPNIFFWALEHHNNPYLEKLLNHPLYRSLNRNRYDTLQWNSYFYQELPADCYGLEYFMETPLGIHKDYMNTPLGMAFLREYYDTVELLLDQGAYDKQLYTLQLMMNDGPMIPHLAKKLIKSNTAETGGALATAIYRENTEIITQLHQAGTSLDLIPHALGRQYHMQDQHPLVCALEDNRIAIAKLLLNLGANINKPTDKKGNTPLLELCMRSAIGHYLPAIYFLLKEGADCTIKNKDGGTALLYAAIPRKDCTCSLDTQGHSTIEPSQDAATALLLDHGALVPTSTEYRDLKGNTFLHRLAQGSTPEIMSMVLKALQKQLRKKESHA